MNSGATKAAQSIPDQVEGIHRSVAELCESLAQVDGLLQSMADLARAGVIGGSGAAATAAGAEGTHKVVRRGRRRGKLFPTGAFTMNLLGRSTKGLRPRDIADALRQAAPGAHKNALSLVNTTLGRLRIQKKAVNSGGIWRLA